jgi:hypothetical protein
MAARMIRAATIPPIRRRGLPEDDVDVVEVEDVDVVDEVVVVVGTTTVKGSHPLVAIRLFGSPP